MDAGYGNNSELRADITALGLTYVAGILSNTTVWAPGTGPLPAKTWTGCGRPPKLLRRDREHQPASVKELALGLPERAWRTISCREGTAGQLSSRFARVRVHVTRRDFKRTAWRQPDNPTSAVIWWALRPTKVSALDPPSTWWPGEW